MEKQLQSARKLVNKIVKGLGRNDLDWTCQVSINSTRPERVNYCCQIEAPANGLQPITWIKESWEELEEALKIAAKGLDQKAVEKAYLESEIQRANEKIKFYEDSLKQLEEES